MTSNLCPITTYPDVSNKNCASCLSLFLNCYACEENKCLSCLDKFYYLSTTFECIEASKCPITTYPDTKN